MPDKDPYIRIHLSMGILVVHYQEGIIITGNIARDIVRERKAFTKEKNYPVLIFSFGVERIDHDARKFMSSPEGVEGLLAVAIVASSIVHAMMGNFLMNVHRTSIPVKIFTDTDKARKWLSKFIVTEQLE